MRLDGRVICMPVHQMTSDTECIVRAFGFELPLHMNGLFEGELSVPLSQVGADGMGLDSARDLSERSFQGGHDSVKRLVLIVAAIQSLVCLPALAASQTLQTASFLSFQEAEKLALANSHALAAQDSLFRSAEETARAQKSKRYPALNFNAQSLFMSKIGAINLPSLNTTRQVGDHINWSVGPTLEWVVWDTGQITKMAQSLHKVAEAEQELVDASGRQVLLAVRSAYIGVQLAKEQLRLVEDALSLARAQYADVAKKQAVGAADRLDLTVAHQEVVDREKDLESAKGELGVTKRTLLAELGLDAQRENPDDIDVEPIKHVLATLLPRAEMPVEIASHPQVRALADRASASDLAAKSSTARHWPKITMLGSSTFEYPNFGENTTIQQNKLTLGLQVPILDWGMISRETRSLRYRSSSASEQMAQASIDLSRTASSITERIRTLKELRKANVQAVRDAVEVASLSYDAYLAGRVIFLDVQRANVKALSAKVEAARTDAELAGQIARLLALAESEGER